MSTLVEQDLTEITALEGRVRSIASSPPPATGLWSRRRWVIGMVLAVLWAYWGAGVGREPIVNRGGWTIAGRFVSGIWNPELDGEFLRIVARASVTTVEYALVATALSLLLGVIGGVLVSERFWEGDSYTSQPGRTAGLVVARVVNVVPRGVHEAVWALVLLLVLGADPLVAVMAIAVPFGAITAKVIGEMIDDAPVAPYRALRQSGAGRLAAIAYGIGPSIGSDVMSYGFYRLECSVRSSVVIGMIGAGGIGFQIAVSEDGLRYGELWTLIFALIVMSGLADAWGASLRRSRSTAWLRTSTIIATVMTALAAVHLGLAPWRLWSGSTRSAAARVATDAWPPKLPRGGWSELFESALSTLQLSIIAISIAALCAVPIAFVAARPSTPGIARSMLSRGSRFVLLFCRAVPPPLWALLVLFMTYPGPLAGGVALGLYTLGVLGRLDAEVVENSDPAAANALRVAGASSASTFAYATLPTVSPRFASLGLYRWEVAIRETVIVGLVGAGGLGRLLQEQRAGFDEARMLTTILTLIALALAVDVVSSRLRRVLR